MKINTRGFIPLVAIILLGLTAVTGGVIATVSIQHNRQPEVANKKSMDTSTVNPAYLPPVSTNVRSSATVATSTRITVGQTPVKHVAAKGAISNYTYQYSALIEDFLKNQTIENFRDFCTTAKGVPGHGGVKQILNEDRTALVSKPITLYDEMKSCALFLKEDSDNRGQNYLWTASPQNLVLTLNLSDSDEIRKSKLEYNNKLKSYIPNTLVGYMNYGEGGMTLTPNQAMLEKEKQIALASGKNKEAAFAGYQVFLLEMRLSIVVPREDLCKAEGTWCVLKYELGRQI